MNEVSLFRLYLLRAMYLLVVVGLAVVVWPGILHRTRPWELMEGAATCMLAAFSLLALLGLRYPLQMLPVLLWEFLWKAIWMVLVALPLWTSGQMDEATWMVATQCMVGILIPFVVPWGYVYARYVRQDGDRWRAAMPAMGNEKVAVR